MARYRRALHKLWKNKTPVGFTRRVRWYEGHTDVRLNMQDDWHECNLFYQDKDTAQDDYEYFISQCEELEKVHPAWRQGYVNTDITYHYMSPVNLTTKRYESRNAA
jgi:hypothetical protein